MFQYTNMIKYILLLSSLVVASGQGVLMPSCPDTCADKYNIGASPVDICPRDPLCRSYCDWCVNVPYNCAEICSFKASPCKFDQCVTCDSCLNRTPVVLNFGSLFEKLLSVAAPISDCTERTQDVYNKCMKRTRRDEAMCDEYSDIVYVSCVDCHEKKADDIGKCIKDKPRENCNKQSIRILKKCMYSGESDKKCKALSSRMFFDCYQY